MCRLLLGAACSGIDDAGVWGRLRLYMSMVYTGWMGAAHPNHDHSRFIMAPGGAFHQYVEEMMEKERKPIMWAAGPSKWVMADWLKYISKSGREGRPLTFPTGGP